MCKALFTEYNDGCKFYELSITLIINQTHIIFYHNGVKASEPIHWFELCMTKVLAKLSKDDNNELGRMLHDIYVKQFKHPVDYLYEKFKEIK